VRTEIVVLGFKHVHRSLTSQAVNNTQLLEKTDKQQGNGQRDFNSSAGASYALNKLRDAVENDALK
jgi:hypothetical protein